MQIDSWTSFFLASILIAIFTLGFWIGVKATDPNPISGPTNSIDCKGHIDLPEVGRMKCPYQKNTCLWGVGHE